MKAAILTLILVLASLSAPRANATLIMSGLDDTCQGCSLSNLAGGAYVIPTGTVLDGALWIQDATAWRQVGSQTIFESDFDGVNQFFRIVSLFVSFDDTLIITNGSNVLFDASNYNIATPWSSIIDVISYTGELTFDASNGLSFLVENTGGATGVIWKGEITAVSAPSVMGLMGLCIAFMCCIKRKK